MKCFVCKETFEEPKISYFGKDRFAIAYCPICTACLPRCDAQSPTAGEISEAMVERAAKAYRENLRGKTIDDHRRAMRAALSAVSLTRLPDGGDDLRVPKTAIDTLDAELEKLWPTVGKTMLVNDEDHRFSGLRRAINAVIVWSRRSQ